MHKNYFLEVIGEKPVLFAAMLRFNGITPDSEATKLPNSLAGLSAQLPAACLDELWRHGPSRKHLRTLAPETAEPFWDFSEESRCLIFLEPESLKELALYYGATLHAPEIMRTIMRDGIADLREALGERAYIYALQRGQYRVPAARAEFSDRHREMPLAQRAPLHGKEALGIIVSGWPQELQQRVPFAAPADMPLSPALQKAVWFDMKTILLKEVASEWASCFV